MSIQGKKYEEKRDRNIGVGAAVGGGSALALPLLLGMALTPLGWVALLSTAAGWAMTGAGIGAAASGVHPDSRDDD